MQHPSGSHPPVPKLNETNQTASDDRAVAMVQSHSGAMNQIPLMRSRPPKSPMPKSTSPPFEGSAKKQLILSSLSSGHPPLPRPPLSENRSNKDSPLSNLERAAKMLNVDLRNNSPGKGAENDPKTDDEVPEEVKVAIFDGFDDDEAAAKSAAMNLAWLESAFLETQNTPAGDSFCSQTTTTASVSSKETSTITPDKNETSIKPQTPATHPRRQHRRSKSFSWDGGSSSALRGRKPCVTPSPKQKNHNSSSLKYDADTNSKRSSVMGKLRKKPPKSSKKKGRKSPQSDDGKNGPSRPRAPSPSNLFRGRKVAVADSASGKPPTTPVQPMSRIEVHELATSCLKRGDYDTALSLSEDILLEEQKRYGPHHATVGTSLHNIAMVHLHASRLELAESVFWQAVMVRKKSLDVDHLDVAVSLSKLATVRMHIHKYDDALAAFLEALRITRKHAGYDDCRVAQIQSQIGCLYYEAGEYMAAQATFEDALDVYRTQWASGIDQDTAVAAVAEMLCNIGSIQTKRKKFDSAISSFQEALNIQRRIMGEVHPRVIATLDNMAFAFSKSKNYVQAQLYYNEMLRAQVTYYGSYNDECYRTLKKLHLMYEKQKKRSPSLSPPTAPTPGGSPMEPSPKTAAGTSVS